MQIKYKTYISPRDGFTQHTASVGMMYIVMQKSKESDTWHIALSYRGDLYAVNCKGSLRSAKQKVRREIKKYIRLLRCELRFVWNRVFNLFEEKAM